MAKTLKEAAELVVRSRPVTVAALGDKVVTHTDIVARGLSGDTQPTRWSSPAADQFVTKDTKDTGALVTTLRKAGTSGAAIRAYGETLNANRQPAAAGIVDMEYGKEIYDWAVQLSANPFYASAASQYAQQGVDRFSKGVDGMQTSVANVQTAAGQLGEVLDKNWPGAPGMLLAQTNHGTQIPGASNLPPKVQQQIQKKRGGPQPYSSPLVPDLSKMTPQQQWEWLRKNGVNVVHRYSAIFSKDAQGIVGLGERAGYYTLNKWLALPAAQRNLKLQQFSNEVARLQNKLSPAQNQALQGQIRYNAQQGREAGQRAFDLNEANAQYQTIAGGNAQIAGSNRSNEAKYGAAVTNQQAQIDSTSAALGEDRAGAALTNEYLVPLSRGEIPPEIAAQVRDYQLQGWSPRKILTWLQENHSDVLYATGRPGERRDTVLAQTDQFQVPTSNQVVGEWLEKPPPAPQTPLYTAEEQAAKQAAEQARLRLQQTPNAAVTVPPGLINRNAPVPNLEKPTWTVEDTTNYQTNEKNAVEAFSTAHGIFTATPWGQAAKAFIELNPLLNKIDPNPVNWLMSQKYGENIDWLYSDFLPIQEHLITEGMNQAEIGAQNTAQGFKISQENLGLAANNNAQINQAGINQTRDNTLLSSENAQKRAAWTQDLTRTLQGIDQQYDSQLQQTTIANGEVLSEKGQAAPTETSNLFTVTSNYPAFEQAHPGSTRLIQAVLARHSLSGAQVTMDALRQAYDQYYGAGEFARLLRSAAP